MAKLGSRGSEICLRWVFRNMAVWRWNQGCDILPGDVCGTVAWEIRRFRIYPMSLGWVIAEGISWSVSQKLITSTRVFLRFQVIPKPPTAIRIGNPFTRKLWSRQLEMLTWAHYAEESWDILIYCRRTLKYAIYMFIYTMRGSIWHGTYAIDSDFPSIWRPL